MTPEDEDQLEFGFLDRLPEAAPHDSARGPLPEPLASADSGGVVREPAQKANHSAETLTEHCREWLHSLDLPGAAKLIQVRWNTRLQSTAGYAAYPAWRIDLNPRLRDFEGQVMRTLKHELAHLIAYHRASRRRIEPHGREWQAACAQLGIPGEKPCHSLPLPRRRVKRKLAYQCPACETIIYRVRRFRHATACLNCCNQHAGGRFDARFKLVPIPMPEESGTDEG